MAANNTANLPYTSKTSWSPTLIGGTSSGSTTYSTQQGYYVILSTLNYIQGTLVISAATGTGVARFSNLPNSVNGQTQYKIPSPFQLSSASWSWGGATFTETHMMWGNDNTTSGNLTSVGPTSAGATNISVTNNSATFKFSGIYNQ